MELRSDQEPSIKALKARVKEEMPSIDIVLEESPVGEHQSNGEVENAAGRIQGQYRTIKSDVETQFGHKIKGTHPALV